MTRVFWHDEAHPLDTSKASRARPRPLRTFTLEQGGKRYRAYDCHSLLEHENEADRARPGHLFG